MEGNGEMTVMIAPGIVAVAAGFIV